MDWLFIFGLLAGLVYLRNRLRVAERRLDAIEHAHSLGAPARPQAEAEGETEPPTPKVSLRASSVPVVKRSESDPDAETRQPAPDPQPADEPAPAAAFAAEAPDVATQAISGDRGFALPKFDFEDIFGRRLPIWAGGITLAIAGVFLVRYSIEAGLLTPAVRVVMAFLFGFALLAGAEAAYRFEDRVADPRVRQALAGAGLATLYAGFYLAGTQYGLIGQTFAFLGLAAVTAGAIALSFRFGLPAAVLGLIGGFAAPALVGGEEANLPLLSLYLGLVTAGLTVSGKRQNRPWLGIAALVGGLGWGALLLLADDPGFAEILALGLYFIVLGAVLPALTGEQRFEKPLRYASALVASVQLALLVDQGGYAPLAWGLYLLLGATLAYLSWKRPDLRELNSIAAVIGVLLLAQWDNPPAAFFAVVGALFAVVFAGIPLAFLWRGEDREVDVIQLSAVPVGLAIVAYGTFGEFGQDFVEPQLAAATAALGAIPILAALRLWSREGERLLALALGSAGLLLFGALLLVTPGWAAVIVAAAVFAGLMFLLRDRWNPSSATLLWSFAVLSLLALTGTESFGREIARPFGDTDAANALRGFLRWLIAIAPWATLAWREKVGPARRTAEALAALLAYGAVAQILPEEALAWSAAAGAILLWRFQPARLSAQTVLTLVAGLWAVGTLAEWSVAGLDALAGAPLFVGDIADWQAAVFYLLPVASALALVRFPSLSVGARSLSLRWLAPPILIVAAHIAYKQGFAIETVTAFVDLGMAERTLWQALLLGTACAAFFGLPGMGRHPFIAAKMAILTLLHSSWFTGLLHNPLWDRQAVGATPIANLILAATAIAIGAALLLRRMAEERIRPWLDGLVMAIASVGALALLRHLFGGTIPVDEPLGQTEDLLRSLLGIVLALFFLFVGSTRGERSWRVGSLVLMLLAVGKVFLFDAAELEGLLRIASFMALGFSLIGIGWVYARQLRASEERG